MEMLLPYREWPDPLDFRAVRAFYELGAFPPEDIPWVAVRALEAGIDDDVVARFAGLSKPTRSDFVFDPLYKIELLWGALGVGILSEMQLRAHLLLYLTKALANDDFWQDWVEWYWYLLFSDCLFDVVATSPADRYLKELCTSHRDQIIDLSYQLEEANDTSVKPRPSKMKLKVTALEIASQLREMLVAELEG